MKIVAVFHVLVLGLALAAPARAVPLTPEAINAAEFSAKPVKGLNPVVLKAQVLLDRAGFSPGVIDARGGENFNKALKAFQEKNGLDASGTLDEATFNKLAQTSSDPIVTEYEIRSADVKGPFVKKIPRDYKDMAKLKHLGYRSPRELLAEKFHMDEDLLRALNTKKPLTKAGTTIVVANVMENARAAMRQASRRNGKDTNTGSNRAVPNAGSTSDKVARVEINKRERSVRVYGEDGGLVAFYPASIGSAEKPAPSGGFAVRAVAHNPVYRYNPDYAFKGQKATEPVEIAPGPNNPVGVVWIALTVDSYGIHGTPDPSKVSKTYSHGCIRLTNWDAKALAKMVKKGTPVEFTE